MNENVKTDRIIINKTKIDALPKIIKVKKYNINGKSIKNSKSIGKLILEQKKRIKNNRNKIHNKLNRIMNSLNDSLHLSNELLNQTKPKLNEMNKKILFSPKVLDEIKKDKYYKKWHFNETFNNINKTNELKEPNEQKEINNIKILSLKTKILEKENKEISFLNKTQYNKRILKPKQIVKISKIKLYSKNDLMKYALYLNNNIDKYIESKGEYEGFYDFDKKLRKMIKETKVGIDFPGNILQRNVLTYIKTFNPKSVTHKHIKNYSVKDTAFISFQERLKKTKLSYIKKKDVYSYKNLLY